MRRCTNKLPGGRPIQIERVGRDRGDIRETIENLPDDKGPGPSRVGAHLRDCTEVVYLEMGIDDSLNLGATLAVVLAFFIAEQGGGLIGFYGRDWASPDDRSKTLWTTA